MFEIKSSYSWNNVAITEEINEEDYIFGILNINEITNNTSQMNETNDYQVRENIGRKYFTSWLKDIGVTEYEFTADPYAVVDCDFNFKDKDITAEIKVRDIKYKDYTTHLMELNKYINIQNYVTKNNKNGAIYANFFGENWLYVYKVNNINTSYIRSKELVVATSEDKGMTNKDIIEIPTDTAQIFYRKNINTKWTRIK